MNITRHPDGSVTVTLSAGEATDLTDELLWVKNVDEDGPVRADAPAQCPHQVDERAGLR